MRRKDARLADPDGESQVGKGCVDFLNPVCEAASDLPSILSCRIRANRNDKFEEVFSKVVATSATMWAPNIYLHSLAFMPSSMGIGLLTRFVV